MNYQDLPTIDDVVVTYIDSLAHDGPLCGHCHVWGKTAFFGRIYIEGDPTAGYGIYVFDDAITREMIVDRELFEKMVGTHWSFDMSGRSLPIRSGSSTSRDNFYRRKVKYSLLDLVEKAQPVAVIKTFRHKP